MGKIKITSKEKEIEGDVFGGLVKPFGTSAHIPFSRKYVGSHIDVIVPSERVYCWIFSERERSDLIREAYKILNEYSGKLHPLLVSAVEKIEANRFSIGELFAICDLLDDKRKLVKLVKKIRKNYHA